MTKFYLFNNTEFLREDLIIKASYYSPVICNNEDGDCEVKKHPHETHSLLVLTLGLIDAFTRTNKLMYLRGAEAEKLYQELYINACPIIGE